MKWSRRGGTRASAPLAACLIALVCAAPGHADLKVSRSCRKTLGRELGKVAGAGLKATDACYKTQHKAAQSPAQCNVLGSPANDPKGKYGGARTGSTGKIGGACLAGDPVLANYVPSGDPAADVIPAIEADVSGNSIAVLGNQNLGDPKLQKVDIKCSETIGKNRTKIVNEILKGSTKCQDGVDAAATTFGPLDPSCVVTSAVKAGPKAMQDIQEKCVNGPISADAAGCFPLPACVLGASELAAQTLARTMYSNVPPPPPVCGNGLVESPEQCDDNNTNPGDGCSATCESEGPSCDAVAGSTIIGARQVTVAIGGLAGGQKLAGVRINLDYPQFQAGIAGSGQSSIVQSKVMVLQGNPGDYIALANDHDTDLVFVIGGTGDFIDNGDLIKVTMDACFAKQLNLCNRNQNVIGCCDSSTDLDGDTTFQECGDPNAPVVCPAGSFPTSTVGIPTVPPALEDCCPADNACVTQAAATSCTVTDPVDFNGIPVDGVTCSVTVSGT